MLHTTRLFEQCDNAPSSSHTTARIPLKRLLTLESPSRLRTFRELARLACADHGALWQGARAPPLRNRDRTPAAAVHRQRRRAGTGRRRRTWPGRSKAGLAPTRLVPTHARPSGLSRASRPPDERGGAGGAKPCAAQNCIRRGGHFTSAERVPGGSAGARRTEPFKPAPACGPARGSCRVGRGSPRRRIPRPCPFRPSARDRPFVRRGHGSIGPAPRARSGHSC